MHSLEGAPSSKPRVLVVGCGGIGGVVAAHLLEQGHDITTLTTNGLIADAINAGGLRIRGEASPGTVSARALRKLDAKTAPFDFVLLATQPPQVEEAARSALGHLLPSGRMVCFQNGLCEERIQAIAGADRVIGAVVAWGASMLAPGVYERTSAGGFVLGRVDGQRDGRIDQLSQLLEAVGPTSITDNLSGARWSKLAINCAISSLGTIGGDRIGVLMRHRFVRRLALEIMTETVHVARAIGIRLEKVSGTLDLDWLALLDTERSSAGSPGLVAKHALLLAVGARYRRLRSSMLAAIERGRPPAVEFLNGEVVTRGSALGIPTPVNYAVREQVLAIATGEHRSSLDLARAVYERTRAVAMTPFSATERAAPVVIEAPSSPIAMKDGPAAAPFDFPGAELIELEVSEDPIELAGSKSHDNVAPAWPTEPSQ
jgi:2-dehydropantoate 2-reductase